MKHDIIIRNGTVVDGTGAPARRADVAIKGDRIVEITDLDDGGIDAKGAREIDAEGRLVTPGFVDIHTHLDAQLAWDPIGDLELLARRHERGHGELRRHVRAVPAR